MVLLWINIIQMHIHIAIGTVHIFSTLIWWYPLHYCDNQTCMPFSFKLRVLSLGLCHIFWGSPLNDILETGLCTGKPTLNVESCTYIMKTVVDIWTMQSLLEAFIIKDSIIFLKKMYKILITPNQIKNISP